MSNDLRSSYQMIDNQVGERIIPRRQIPKYDLGLLKKENSKQCTFRWNYKNIEKLRDAKFHLKIKVGGGSVTKAVLDGGVVALFAQSQLRKQDDTPIEHNNHINRVKQVHKMITSGVDNLNQRFESMDDNLYKDDHATSGTASDIRKRHLTTTAQWFSMPFTDLFNFPVLNDVWHSDLNGGLECVLVFDKDKNVLSGCDGGVNPAVEVIVTEIKLEIPVLIKDQSLKSELMKIPDAVFPYESYQYHPVLAEGSENHISIKANVNNLVGVGLHFRDNTQENVVATLGATGARYLTSSMNPDITSLQIKIGDVMLPQQPITTQPELWNYAKEFFAIQYDTDNTGLLDYWNFNGDANITHDGLSLKTTELHHLFFDLSKHGIGSGVKAVESPVEIDFTCSAVDDRYCDVVLYYMNALHCKHLEARRIK